jgi:lipid II:glycine glycyltransferase (peptidoglycan interpeptide bridge formation enzyme)
VIIDLRVSEEALHKGMTRRVRRYIRSAERKGITIHEGTESDLPTFLNLLRTTASDRGWSIFNDKYYQNMWKTLHPTGNVRLTLASRENEYIAALLIYIHGMNVYGKTLVRTGKHDNSGGHELLLWESIKWAKSYGYRFYDLSKIDLKTAKLYQERTQPLKEISGTADFSKLKYGGSIVQTPKAYAYLYHPMLRAIYRLLFQIIQRLSASQGIVGNIRGVQNISGSKSKLDLG